MTRRNEDIERLTTLLGQCLGRIDERAYDLQRLADDEEDYGAADALEHEAATLQELVAALIEQSTLPDRADLNRCVTSAVQACLDELGRPVVVRQRLTQRLPLVSCSPGQVALAVQRALMIGLGRLDAGGELVVATRRDGESAVLEIECQGKRRDRHLHERTATLCEFIGDLQGTCRVDEDHSGTLLLAIELPLALAADEL